MPTTERGLTYPDATGHTRLWEHIQALADSAEAALDALDPAWTNLALAGPTYVARTGYLVPAYRVIGNKVELRGGITKSSNIASGDVVLTLPLAARPVSANIWHPISLSRGGSTTAGVAGRLDIVPAGTCTVQVDSTSPGPNLSLDGVSFWRQ